MRYSNVILTDDNFDEEFEKLCELMGYTYESYENFVEELEEDFNMQYNNGIEEWLRYGVYPNKGSDFRQAYQIGQVAYEFGNGFIVLNYETIL